MKTYSLSRIARLAFSQVALAALPAVALAQQGDGGSLQKTAEEFQKRLDRATVDLAQLRAEIEAKKVPLTKKLNELEEEVIEARKKYDEVLRLRDNRTLDVTNLNARIRSRQDTEKYVGNLLDEFLRNAESRIHQTEVERYGKLLTDKRNEALNPEFTGTQKLQARLDSLSLFAKRLEDGLGGDRFKGTAVSNASGTVNEGEVLLLGPIAYFASNDGTAAGLADAQLNSTSTVVKDLPLTANPGVIAETVKSGKGPLPIDPTRGSAFQVEETKDSVADQFRKGGPVMWPIGALGVVAVLIGLIKWLSLALVGRPSTKRVKKFLAALDVDDKEEAAKWAKKTGGPVGRMMQAGANHYRDPSTMMEEAMFESLLDAKTKLNSWIPFIKIAAAVEPLLGLLGTVTGMINTFRLITIFGTGDASTFSSGISESLLTTMWGLITAIPCLLMAAFLARKAKGALDDMEKLAVRMMNHRNHQDAIRQRGKDASDEPDEKPTLSGPKESKFQVASERKIPVSPVERKPEVPSPPPPSEEGGGGIEPLPAT